MSPRGERSTDGLPALAPVKPPAYMQIVKSKPDQVLKPPSVHVSKDNKMPGIGLGYPNMAAARKEKAKKHNVPEDVSQELETSGHAHLQVRTRTQNLTLQPNGNIQAMATVALMKIKFLTNNTFLIVSSNLRNLKQYFLHNFSEN